MADDPRTYIRLHDGITDHPKIARLSDSGFRTLIECWCWCSRHLTDGFIPDAQFKRFGTRKARDELVMAGMVQAGDDDLWFAHDYLQHQRSAAEVSELRTKRRVAGQASARARAERNVSKRSTRVEQLAQQTRSKTATETETETEERETSSRSQRDKRATKPPDLMPVTDEMRTWAAESAPDVRLVVETARMLDWHRSNGKAKIDWQATWRNWMRKAQGDVPSSQAAGGFTRSDTSKKFG